MLELLRIGLWFLCKLLTWPRYEVHVHGRGALQGLKKGVLILPSHPALVDPIIVTTWLFPRLRPRPMLWEGNFQNPLLKVLIKAINPLGIPDLGKASAEGKAQAEAAVQGVIDGLKRGDNHILWPAGHLQHEGREVLGGARGVTDILQGAPDAEVLLVRTRGLWGSRLSRAYTGTGPSLGEELRRGLLTYLANLFVLTPRRRVDITLHRLDRSTLPPLKRELINPWLEKWYNAPGAEKPMFVPYHFLLGPNTHAFPPIAASADIDFSQIKPESRTAVNDLLVARLGRPLTVDEERPATTLDQLGLDSLDRMDLSLRVERELGFGADQVPATLGLLWAQAQGQAPRVPPRPPEPVWFAPPSPGRKVVIEGETIAECFVHRALANPRDVAAADDLAGVVTYEKLLVGALLLARRFAKVAAPNVGLMLPASVSGSMAYLALLMAKKLPVLLNWTTGPANVASAIKLIGLTHVVTSRAFVERAGIEVEGVEFLYLEDVSKAIGKLEALRALLQVRWFPGQVKARMPRPNPDDPAVILFTSGSEKAPKAVPLTHRNLVSNQRMVVSLLELSNRDCMLGFLPAFHSFGLSMTGVMPLLAGMRVVYHPDPTDASGLVHKIAAYGPTILVGTPTFIGHIFARASKEQLKTVRIIVVGAEKCPASLFARCRELAPQAHLLEGYGITECSPVVSSNLPDAYRDDTVGKPLPGVEVQIVDLDTEKPLGVGQMGMLWVAGPTIFPDYLGFEGPSPFRERDGKRWYVTGDLAELDAQGFIHLRGRLKRFLKAGGEMISLPALEEPLVRAFPPTQDGPRVAIEGIEKDGGRRIVLFATEPIQLAEANAKLAAEGFRGVMRIDEVRQLESLPVLGTGKTDYKVLRGMISE